MRIVHVNLARGYRGGERQTELLIRALAGMGVPQALWGRTGEPLLERLRDVPRLDRLALNPPYLGALPASRGRFSAAPGRSVLLAIKAHGRRHDRVNVLHGAGP